MTINDYNYMQVFKVTLIVILTSIFSNNAHCSPHNWKNINKSDPDSYIDIDNVIVDENIRTFWFLRNANDNWGKPVHDSAIFVYKANCTSHEIATIDFAVYTKWWATGEKKEFPIMLKYYREKGFALVEPDTELDNMLDFVCKRNS